MSDPDDLDAVLKQHFADEHQRPPAEPFVTATLQKVRAERRRRLLVQASLSAVAFAVVVLISPTLIAGATHLNAALESWLSAPAAVPGAWAMGVLALAALLLFRRRSR